MSIEYQTVNGLTSQQAITKFVGMSELFDFWNLGVEDLAEIP